MRKNLRSLLSARQRTLSLVESLDQGQMDRHPARGRWSVGEVLDHLLLTERFYRGEIADLIRAARAGRRARKDRTFEDLDVSFLFIPRTMLPYLQVPVSVMTLFTPRCLQDYLLEHNILPLQHPTVAAPRGGRPADELRSELETSADKTRRMIEENSDLDYDTMRHYHPLLGPNTASSLVSVVALHEQRHHAQIEGALSARAA